MIRECDVCGKTFDTCGKNVIFCGDECRKKRHRETCRKAMTAYKLRQIEEKKAAEMEPESKFLSIDEIAKLLKDSDLSYGYYVGLNYAKGVRV